jgi:hypothetical protein
MCLDFNKRKKTNGSNGYKSQDMSQDQLSGGIVMVFHSVYNERFFQFRHEFWIHRFHRVVVAGQQAAYQWTISPAEGI